MCKVLKRARSGYYAWVHRQDSPRDQENNILSDQIEQIYQDSRQTYGSPRIQAALLAKGFRYCLGLNQCVENEGMTPPGAMF